MIPEFEVVGLGWISGGSIRPGDQEEDQMLLFSSPQTHADGTP